MILTLVACGQDHLDEDLWARIEGYEDWEQLDPWLGVQQTEPAHSDYVQVWLNPEWMASAGDEVAAEDAIAVKRAYGDAEGTEERSLTVMWKTSEYKDSETGWYWASFGDDGTASAAGEPGMCTGCHTEGSDGRMILVTEPK